MVYSTVYCICLMFVRYILLYYIFISRLRRFQLALKRYIGAPMPLMYGNGLLPFARPISEVVGAPLRVERCEQPTAEKIDALHAEYCRRLEELFEAHKAKFGISPETHLEFASGD